jgi:hypothetical protein
MMVRHLVLLAWKPEATAAQKAAAAAQLAMLPTLVPVIRAFATGPSLGLRPDSYDFAVSADFDNADDYLTYRDHPLHVALVEQYITPIRADGAAIQFELPATAEAGEGE